MSATGPGTTVSTTASPIAVGDLIAIENGGPSDKIGLAGGPGAFYAYWNPALAPGEMRAPSSVFAGELAFNADVVPAPAVTAIVPGAGSVNGGTPVGIVGSDAPARRRSRRHPPRAELQRRLRLEHHRGRAAWRRRHRRRARDDAVGHERATSDADRYAYLTAGPAAPPVGLPTPPPPGALAALVGAPRATSSGVRLTVGCAGPAGASCALATRLVVFAPKGAAHAARGAAVHKAKKAKRAAITSARARPRSPRGRSGRRRCRWIAPAAGCSAGSSACR